MGAVVAVAACGPVPKPFRQSESQKVEIDLVRPDQSRSLILVVPLLDPPHASITLQNTLQRSFENAGIPATLKPDRADAPFLVGSQWQEAGRMGLRWELFGADGNLQTVAVVDGLPVSTEWAEQSDTISQGVADVVVAEILPSLRPTAGRLTPHFNPAVYVADSSGAPGDGNEALRRAALNALDRAGVQRTDSRESAALILYAVVKVVSLDEDSDAVRIRWFMEQPNGESIGRLTQQNLVAAGSLQEHWGLAAFDAAEAIVEPVGEALLTLNPSSASVENQNQ